MFFFKFTGRSIVLVRRRILHVAELQLLLLLRTIIIAAVAVDDGLLGPWPIRDFLEFK